MEIFSQYSPSLQRSEAQPSLTEVASVTSGHLIAFYKNNEFPEAFEQPLLSTHTFTAAGGFCSSFGLTYVEQLMSFGFFAPSVRASCAPGSDRSGVLCKQARLCSSF